MGTKLKYIPIQDFLLIPRYLIEQIEPADFNIENLYKLSPLVCASPYNLLGAFAKEGEIKGYMWGSINPITEKIVIHHLSIDKEFQGNGIIKEATDILKKIQAEFGLKGIMFTTIKPEVFESAGYIKSELITMEG